MFHNIRYPRSVNPHLWNAADKKGTQFIALIYVLPQETLLGFNLAIVKILVTIFIFLTIIGESIFIHQIKGGKRTWRRGWRRREGSRQPYLTNCLRKFRWCDWKFFVLGEFRSNKIHLQGHNSGNTAPLRSVHWTPGRKILCSWTNHFTFTVPLSAQE